MEDFDLRFIFDALERDDFTEDDDLFRRRTTKQISERDKEYTHLLSHFVNITRIRNYLKEFFKWSFLLTIVSAIVVLIIVVFKLVDKCLALENFEQIVQTLPLLITALLGFVSTVIVIPATITKFLFNTEEDKNITSIIEHTQNHDVNGRAWATENATKKAPKDTPNSLDDIKRNSKHADESCDKEFA